MLKNIIKYIRLKDWGYYILPSVMSFYLLGLLLNQPSEISIKFIIKDFILFGLLTFCVAAFGFYINEWTDIKDDIIAGKQNSLIKTDKKERIIVLVIIIVATILLSFFIPWTKTTFIIFTLQYLLFALYSIQPFRLKRFTYPAIILDALYSGTLFYILALYLASPKLNNYIIVIFIFIWGFLKGIRNIDYHQLNDKKHDVLLPLETIATQYNQTTIKKILLSILLPVEIISFILLLVYTPYNIISILLYVFFLIYIVKREKYIIPYILKRKTTITRNIISDFNLFYEQVFPILILVYLTYSIINYIFF